LNIHYIQIRLNLTCLQNNDIIIKNSLKVGKKRARRKNEIVVCVLNFSYLVQTSDFLILILTPSLVLPRFVHLCPFFYFRSADPKYNFSIEGAAIEKE